MHSVCLLCVCNSHRKNDQNARQQNLKQKNREANYSSGRAKAAEPFNSLLVYEPYRRRKVRPAVPNPQRGQAWEGENIVQTKG